MNRPFRKEKIEFAAGAILIVVLLIILAIVKTGKKDADQEIIAEISNLTPEELQEMEREEKLEELTEDYENFGIISTSSYINLRSQPNELDMTNIIGKLENGAALDILEDDGDWSLIKSGNIRGYCKSAYIVTGDQAE